MNAPDAHDGTPAGDGPDDPPVAVAHGPATAAEPDLLAIVQAQLATLDGRVKGLATATERQQDVMLKLHDENQRLRRGELQQAIAPLVRHLIELVDQVEHLVAHLADEVMGPLEIVRRGILEGLRRNGVDRHDIAVGAPFDAQRHYAVGVVPTTDAALDGHVGEVRNGLYVWAADGRVTRAGQVSVYRIEAPVAIAGQQVEAGQDAAPDGTVDQAGTNGANA
ncbi:MAG: nucleotide exchange factor GrpE [Solirubrobacteraceae bacterium]